MPTTRRLPRTSDPEADLARLIRSLITRIEQLERDVIALAAQVNAP